jgi:hypothetical protein
LRHVGEWQAALIADSTHGQLALFDEAHQVRTRDIEQIGSLLHGEFDNSRCRADSVPLGQLGQHLEQQFGCRCLGRTVVTGIGELQLERAYVDVLGLDSPAGLPREQCILVGRDGRCGVSAGHSPLLQKGSDHKDELMKIFE